MTLTFGLDVDKVKMNQYAKYLVKGNFVQKLLPTHTHTHTHTLDRLFYLDHKSSR